MLGWEERESGNSPASICGRTISMTPVIAWSAEHVTGVQRVHDQRQRGTRGAWWPRPTDGPWPGTSRGAAEPHLSRRWPSCVPLLPPPPPSDAPTKASTRGRRGQSAAPVAAATGQHPPDPYLYRRVCAPRAASAHQNRAVVHPRPTSTAWRASGTHLRTIWRLVQNCAYQFLSLS
jgi:hypothetical protein